MPDSQGNTGKSAPGKADLADNLLKPRITAERVHSGIHPDKGQSIGSFTICLLERRQSFFLLTQVDVRRREQEMTNVTALCQIEGMIDHLPRLLLLPNASKC